MDAESNPATAVNASADLAYRWRWLFLAVWGVALGLWVVLFAMTDLEDWFPALAQTIHELCRHVAGFWEFALGGQTSRASYIGQLPMSDMWLFPTIHPHHSYAREAMQAQAFCVTLGLPLSIWLFVQYPRAGEGGRQPQLRKCGPQWVRAGFYALLGVGATMWALDVVGLQGKLLSIFAGEQSYLNVSMYSRRAYTPWSCVPLLAVGGSAVVLGRILRPRTGQLLRFHERVETTGRMVFASTVLLVAVCVTIAARLDFRESYFDAPRLDTELFIAYTTFLWASGCRLWLLFRYGPHKAGRAYVDSGRTFCVECGYDLRGSVAAGSVACPECGVGIPGGLEKAG